MAALLADARAPFDRQDWWDLLARHCDIKPCYALARSDDGVALLPLTSAGGTARPLANWYSFRWQPLVTPGADRRALLGAVFADLARSHWRLELNQVPGEDGLAEALAASLRESGWWVAISQYDINHVLPVAGRDYAAYLATRPGTLRSTLRRKGARTACTVHTRFDHVAWALYEEIYRDSWKGAETTPEFLREFAAAEGAAGRLRLGIGRIGGEAVAAQLWTVEGGTAFIHKLAYREQSRANSPGTALTAALMAHVIDEDHVDLVDFGTGDDPYKRDWMETARPRYHISAFRPAAPRAWPHLARAILRRLAPAARGR